jgi:predicted 3-demethylubiquinone-9 3-methyltransferase (glyoxalase superfamily)
MQKIVPFLWFEKDAQLAADFYTKVFGEVEILKTSKLENTPSGTVEVVELRIRGVGITLMAAGPYFKLNPAVSFLVACKTVEEVNEIWEKLSEGSQVLMELATYPFSARYGWIQDKYGVSWQIMFMGDIPYSQRVVPTLMFVGDVCGKAEEAMNYYVSIFKNSKVNGAMRYEAGDGPDKAGTIKHAGFVLDGLELACMDSAHGHKFKFSEATSFLINCQDQQEVDYFWEKLSAVPESEQCGWVKDKYGVSWQVVPTRLDEMLADSDPAKVARVTKAFMEMKKLDIAELEKAFAG